MSEAGEVEITALWPSVVLVQRLGDHAEHTARLATLLDAGAEGGEFSFSTDDPSVGWLKANVAHGIGACLQRAGFSSPPRIAVRARADRQALGDFRALCTRPGAYLTGLFVISAPGGDTLGVREDRRPGCITFYDPRTGINVTAIRKDPYVRYHRTIRLEPGLLLIWPAYLPHFLHPHLAHEPALRIGLDVEVAADPLAGGAVR